MHDMYTNTGTYSTNSVTTSAGYEGARVAPQPVRPSILSELNMAEGLLKALHGAIDGVEGAFCLALRPLPPDSTANGNEPVPQMSELAARWKNVNRGLEAAIRRLESIGLRAEVQ